MSWNYQLQRINDSFQQIANWYKEFMHRSEQAFRALHQRISYLEDRQAWQGPSDEQVERVLRKILAERFADPGIQRVQNPNDMKDGAYFVQRPKEDISLPVPLPIDVSSLQVGIDAVPSKTYSQDFQMLESKLGDFPAIDMNGPPSSDSDFKDSPMHFKRQITPQTKQDREIWS
ncbi:hypothetical protein BU24DRAFT_42362 [Aaosphaeria arxii CBS 175.79]|uniref:Uncharacterized protein n=1 Tax=Aaosphaeria arxii CBS 175.79 TaxID=1450172 RepID=A0A6A5YCG9_9PLEO|nr:uncharacterized protein BU24DRAFT_42362 [Aaosphaeria arxii CBS 175.79]KAF2022314.1 hypothetical protein BU24DRAFT_42362 [Aaosphaeria arxii CBS 175.79]